MRNFGEHLTYRLPDGSEAENRNVVIFGAAIVIGHREVTNVIRYKLDGAG